MASYCPRPTILASGFASTNPETRDREQSGTRWSLRKGSRASMIEFFKEPNFDWMGKAKYFYALSAILLIAGWASIAAKGGMYYGIDFKGGTNVDVRFTHPPTIDQLRAALTSQGLGNTEIQSISDIASGSSSEYLIFIGQEAQT